MVPSIRTLVPYLAVCTMTATTVNAQERAAVRLEASPASLTMTVGDTRPLTITAFDAAGNVVEGPVRIAAPRNALRVRGGQITALAAGSYEVVATTVSGTGRVTIEVTVRWPRVARPARRWSP